MYKVFFNDRIIYCGAGSKNSKIDNSPSFYVTDSKEAGNAWQIFLGDPMLRDMYFFSESDEIAWRLFNSLFQGIDAAGGLVLNSEGKLLCIKRWGKWDLPKGKMEKSEEPAQTALREVEEECGIFPLIEHGFVLHTFHIYQHPKKQDIWVLKKIHWYSMVYEGVRRLVPQVDEDITEAYWFTRDEVKSKVLPNTWKSLLTVFERFIRSEPI